MRAEYVAPPVVEGAVKLELTLTEAIALTEILGHDNTRDCIERIRRGGNGDRGRKAVKALLAKELHYEMYKTLDDMLRGVNK